MTRTIIAALAASLIGLSAGSAAASPAMSKHPSLAGTNVIQVQSATGSEGRRRPDGDGRHFTPGHRYDSAPSHWRRYDSRPRDWDRRGCVIVGPVWFCP
jgi:hypothetical protein